MNIMALERKWNCDRKTGRSRNEKPEKLYLMQCSGGNWWTVTCYENRDSIPLKLWWKRKQARIRQKLRDTVLFSYLSSMITKVLKETNIFWNSLEEYIGCFLTPATLSSTFIISYLPSHHKTVTASWRWSCSSMPFNRINITENYFLSVVP